MYKDVWKRFGTKILMVLCSVLLLGGVAIAVPRLQASVGMAAVAVVQNESEADKYLTTAVTGAAIWIDQDVLKSLVYSPDAAVYPQQLKFKESGKSAKTLYYGTDYRLTPQKDEDWKKPGKVTVTINPLGTELIDDGIIRTIEYEIAKASISSLQLKVYNPQTTDPEKQKDYERYNGINGTLLVDSVSSTVTTERLRPVVNRKEITTGYQFVMKDSSGAEVDYQIGTSIKDKNTLYIKFDNYKEVYSDFEDYYECQFNVRIDLGTQDVTPSVTPTDTTTLLNRDNVSVRDKDGNDLKKNQFEVDYNIDETDRTGTLIVRPLSTDIYAGYYRRVYQFDPIDTSDLMLTFQKGSKFFTPQDFDEDLKGDYQIAPEEFLTTDANQKTIRKDDCKLSYKIVTDRVNHKEIPGATAGLVEIKVDIVGGSVHKGRTGYAYFPVIRNINTAFKKNNTVITNAPKDGVDYTYSLKHGGGYYKRLAKIRFTDAPNPQDLTIDSDNTQFNLSYKLKRWDNQYFEGLDTIKDAGTVYMTIQGKLGDDRPSSASNGGYYGKIVGTDDEPPTLFFKIAKKTIPSSYYIKLGTSSFIPSSSQPNVVDGTRLMSDAADDSFSKLLTELDDRYAYKFYDQDGNEISLNESWSGKTGKFFVEFTFDGNFDGTLPRVEFTIAEFEDQYLRIVYDANSCDQCHVTGSNYDTHMYTGTEHRPNIFKIEYTKDPNNTIVIPKSQYNAEGSVTYQDNINATNDETMAKIIVKLRSGQTITRTFTINPRPLDAGKLIFTKDDEFNGSVDSGFTHEYAGQTKLPEITKLQLKTTDGNIDLTQGKDYKVLGMYDSSGNQVTVDNINTTEAYCYHITAVGENFVNSATDATKSFVATEKFKITARSIADEKIVFDLAPKTPYNAGDSITTYMNYIKGNDGLKITDGKFPGEPNLQEGKHYSIDPIKDISSIHNNGTITFKVYGKGCYDENSYKEVVLKVGRDITDAKIVENGIKSGEINVTKIASTDANGLPQGTASLLNEYGNPNSVKFCKTAQEAQNCNVLLRYYRESSFGNDILYGVASTDMNPTDETRQYRYEIQLGEAAPDDPMNPNGSRYNKIVLTGKSGYYGSIELKVEIKKIDIGNGQYKIEFLNEDTETENDNIYTGEKVTPKFRVVEAVSGGAILSEGNDYEIPKESDWYNNINANEGRTGSNDEPYLVIRGINGFKGTLMQKFTIYKRNIGTQDKDGHWVMNSGFRVDGWLNADHSYTYTPQTKTARGEENGVLPQVQLNYKDKQLAVGKDYNIRYVNNEKACLYKGNGYDALPKVLFVTEGVTGGNFKGNFAETFEIRRVALSDEKQCTVTLKSYEAAFTGEPIHPAVSVVLHRDDGTDYPVTNMENNDPVGYRVEYNTKDYQDTFISVNQTGTFGSWVMVKAIDEKQGNFEGTAPLDSLRYVIYGEFTPNNAGGRNNSRLEITNKEEFATYQPEGLKGAFDVAFYEKPEDGKTGEDLNDYLNNKDAVKHILTENAHYKVNVLNRVGEQDVTISANPEVNYLKGTSPKRKIIIQGNLSAKYMHYEITRDIEYDPTSTEFRLDKYLRVTYDAYDDDKNPIRVPLTYGVDYEFVTPPTNNIGEDNIAYIKPIDGSKFWVGTGEVKYKVTAGLDGVEFPEMPANREYVYQHGMPVLTVEGLKVVLNGKTLKYPDDYKAELIKGDAINVGDHTIRLTGSGKEYTGTYDLHFKIVPYNLQDAVKEDIIKIVYPQETVYTGVSTWPTVESIKIASHVLSDGTKTDESGTAIPAEYETGIGSNSNSHINWTRDPEHKPDFVIRGVGNYTGELTLLYSITRKNIADDDISDEGTQKQWNYDNGREIAPIPVLEYLGRSLNGIKYNSADSNAYLDWQDYATHFTYQHEGDLKRVGKKTIIVRGIGNFRGERRITYEVTPLNIADTELVFTGETPTYNALDQTPAFELVYGEHRDVILQFNGTKAVSDNINNIAAVNITFTNNRNATSDGKLATVTITLAEDASDNYYGSKEATFTILPAPVKDRVSFMYQQSGENGTVDLKNFKLNLPFKGVGNSVIPGHPKAEEDLGEGKVGVYYTFPQNRKVFMVLGAETDAEHDYEISYQYVEPDTDDVEIREGFGDAPVCSYAGKVKVTITGVGNYTDSASYWYYIGTDISADAKISISPTTAIYNSQAQPPKITITGIDINKCTIGKYWNEVAVKNLIQDQDFVNAGTYYIRVEGNPKEGTYSTKPETLTYTITPRAFSNNLIIDGFKREYSYTGYEICPVGISVTDYIDNTKYRLTEDVDYTLTYTNNLNAGTAYINVEGKNNFSGKATANFMITSSTISSGGSGGSNSFLDQGTGEISGSTAVSPGNVNLSMDTVDAMYFTGSPVYPKVSIAGMTENIDYTVTFANNVDVGMAVATITGIGNNNGTITKNFRIIAQLSKCTISPIPAQQYTGSEVKPALTVKCGSNILMEGVDYAATYSNNINIGTATVTLRALNNANYTGTTSTTFSIGNDVGGFMISGYAPSYAYTGKAITPGVVVETGSRTLVQGTEYTVSYANNVNAGTATITVTGIGKYSGTQTANFVIEPKSVQSLETSDIADRTYTGDAYTPDITVSDGSKVLTKGVDYTVTYTNNTEPGVATVVIKGANSNYAGTKIISFKISAVAVKGLKTSNVKYNSLKLKWTKQDYADGYQICNSSSKVLKTVTKNSATITGLSAGKTYKYKVRSYIKNADGTKSYGAFSSVLSATTKLKTPTVKVVSNAKGQARISWSKVSGASGYEIYYKKSASAKYKKLKTVNNANIRVCTVRGMKSGDRAYFRIRAFRNNGSKKVYSSLNPLKVITVK